VTRYTDILVLNFYVSCVMFLDHVACILVTIAISKFLLPHWKHAITETQTVLFDMNTYIIIVATQLFGIINYISNTSR